MKTYDETMDEISVRLGAVMYHQYLSGAMTAMVPGVSHVAGTIAFIYNQNARDVCDDLTRKIEAYSEYLMNED